jgi:hypothetical protein
MVVRRGIINNNTISISYEFLSHLGEADCNSRVHKSLLHRPPAMISELDYYSQLHRDGNGTHCADMKINNNTISISYITQT